MVVAVPRLIAHLAEEDALPLGPEVWAGTSLTLPPGLWRSVLTGDERSGALPVGELFGDLTVAVLRKVQ